MASVHTTSVYAEASFLGSLLRIRNKIDTAKNEKQHLPVFTRALQSPLNAMHRSVFHRNEQPRKCETNLETFFKIPLKCKGKLSENIYLVINVMRNTRRENKQTNK